MYSVDDLETTIRVIAEKQQKARGEAEGYETTLKMLKAELKERGK